MKKIMMSLWALMLVACSQQEVEKDQLKLKETDLTFECGSALDLSPSNYVEYLTTDFEGNVRLYKDNNELELESLTEYWLSEAGEYELQYSIEDEVETVRIHVVDTTPPVIDYDGSQMTFIMGEETVDIASKMGCSDYSKTTITVEGKVDFNTPGDYPITVTAVDEYGNQSTKTFEFNVLEEAVQTGISVRE